ncbi:hypothetical protein H9P43_001125 [Blastocladiella emersonii ATCC 22665]|nr:hypothetical protein H9P43_001125 [Blastocladiella emersonii ATCC 22665]
MAERMVHDPCHGGISFDELSWSVIDTPQFQRLRELKQLGTAYYVFPGASHHRFEHSLGVGHLASEMIGHIRTQQPGLDITREEVESVRLAGLCHDLGHGPFSHVFDSCVMPAIMKGETGWTHEDASRMMFEKLVDENGIEISTDQMRFINALIDGTPQTSERKFLYQVVANKQNSVDVDKFDYLVRDCLNVGLKSSYDPDRLMKNCRVIGDEVCYQVKEAFNFYELFHTRYSLFKRIYTHKTCNAIEMMVTDALVKANDVMRFDEAIRDPDLYLRMTDGVLRDIEFSSDPALAKSRDILRRLRVRDIYKFVDEVIVEYSHTKFLRDKLTPAYIAAAAGASARLSEDDVRVDICTIHYGMKDRDPVSSISFYGKYDLERKVPLKDTEASHLVPRSFCESIVRVYATDSDKSKHIQAAFRKAIEPLLHAIGSQASPSRLHNIPPTVDTTPVHLRKRRSFEDREGDASQLHAAKMVRRNWYNGIPEEDS